MQKNLTTGIINIGSFGLSSSTFNIGNLGDINIGTTVVSKIINIGGSVMTTGSVRLCNTIYFRTNSIASSLANSTISLFNNLTTGTLNIGGSGTTNINGKLNCGTIRIAGYTSYVFHNGANGNYDVTNTGKNIDL